MTSIEALIRHAVDTQINIGALLDAVADSASQQAKMLAMSGRQP